MTTFYFVTLPNQSNSMAIPDLDKMSEQELWAFWRRYNCPSRRDAEQLVGDTRKNYITIASIFACYACNRALVLQGQRENNPGAIEAYDHARKLAFERLPADLRWGE